MQAKKLNDGKQSAHWQSHGEKPKISKLKRIWNSFRSLRQMHSVVEHTREDEDEASDDEEFEYRIKKWLDESIPPIISSRISQSSFNHLPIPAKTIKHAPSDSANKFSVGVIDRPSTSLKCNPKSTSFLQSNCELARDLPAKHSRAVAGVPQSMMLEIERLESLFSLSEASTSKRTMSAYPSASDPNREDGVQNKLKGISNPESFAFLFCSGPR